MSQKWFRIIRSLKKLFFFIVLLICSSTVYLNIPATFMPDERKLSNAIKIRETKLQIIQKYFESNMKAKEYLTSTQMEDDCSPGRHFVYVKTHKTGSTSVYNVLKSYSQRNAMVSLSPKPFPFQGGYPGHIKEKLLFKRKNCTLFPINKLKQNFSVKNHHRFNHTMLKKIMPKDTVYISIVRKPWNNFQSAFYFYYRHSYPVNLMRSNCFQYPFFHVAGGRCINITNYLRLASKSLHKSVPWYFRSKNYQAHDLGLDPLLEDSDGIRKTIETLASQIDLMMITEYMDESMILLKDLLCLKWSDILNLRSGSTHNYVPYNYKDDPEVKKTFEDLYKLDIELYEHFNATFWKKIDAYGREKMNSELEKLKNERSRSNPSMTPSKKPKARSCSVDWEKNGVQLFEELRNNYDYKTMAIILKSKLKKEEPLLNSDQIDLLAKTMLNNGGGCPA